MGNEQDVRRHTLRRLRDEERRGQNMLTFRLGSRIKRALLAGLANSTSGQRRGSGSGPDHWCHLGEDI
jgi:hypothetical protein